MSRVSSLLVLIHRPPQVDGR